MNKKEQLIHWLGDAYAMEQGIVTTLEKHAGDAKGQPKVRAAIVKHIRETKGHASALKLCLKNLGSAPSTFKSGLAQVTSFLAGMPTSLAHDTVIKNAIAEFATEHFEMACYSSLIETATALRVPAVVTACKKILAEEAAQAKLLDSQLKKLTRDYLSGLDKEESGTKTKIPARPSSKGNGVKRRSAKRKSRSRK